MSYGDNINISGKILRSTDDGLNVSFSGISGSSKQTNLYKKSIIEQIKEYEAKYGSENAHALRRHGEGVTLEQLEYRAKTGYTPDGIQLAPQSATRFLDNADLLDAYKQAENFIQSGVTTYNDIIDFGDTVGIGYRIGSSIAENTSLVRIVINNGKVIAIYPLL